MKVEDRILKVMYLHYEENPKVTRLFTGIIFVQVCRIRSTVATSPSFSVKPPPNNGISRHRVT